MKNILKIVFLGIIGFGLLTYLTAPKDPNKNEINYYGGDVVYYELPDDYYLKGFQKFQYQLSRLPKEASYLIFGYLILLNVSILSLVRKSI